MISIGFIKWRCKLPTTNFPLFIHTSSNQKLPRHRFDSQLNSCNTEVKILSQESKQAIILIKEAHGVQPNGKEGTYKLQRRLLIVKVIYYRCPMSIKVLEQSLNIDQIQGQDNSFFLSALVYCYYITCFNIATIYYYPKLCSWAEHLFAYSLRVFMVLPHKYCCNLLNLITGFYPQ